MWVYMCEHPKVMKSSIIALSAYADDMTVCITEGEDVKVLKRSKGV